MRATPRRRSLHRKTEHSRSAGTTRSALKARCLEMGTTHVLYRAGDHVGVALTDDDGGFDGVAAAGHDVAVGVPRERLSAVCFPRCTFAHGFGLALQWRRRRQLRVRMYDAAGHRRPCVCQESGGQEEHKKFGCTLLRNRKEYNVEYEHSSKGLDISRGQ